MKPKDVFVNIRVDNTGTDYADDDYLVILTVPEDVTNEKIERELKEADSTLKRDDGWHTPQYETYGKNEDTIMTQICCGRKNWSYKVVKPEVEFIIY